MLSILAMTLLLVLALLGWGALAAALLGRLAKIELAGAIPLAEYGLLGLALLALIGLLLNFLVALSGAIGLAMIVIGLAALMTWRKRLCLGLGFGLTRRSAVVLWLALIAIFAGLAVGTPMPYDSGLYHLQTILMAEDSRIVLGAANIHFRFGYNSTWLVLCALLSLPGRPLAAAIALNGVAAILCLGGLLERAAAEIRRHGRATPAAIFAIAAVLILVFSKLLPRNIAAPSTDLPGALFTIYAFLLALVAVEAPIGARPDRGRDAALLVGFAVAALSVVAKTSQAPVVLALVVALVAAAPWRAPGGRRLAIVCLATAAVLGAAWVARGLALSGCALYPVSATCIPELPWTIPHAVADIDRAAITSWARIHGGVPDGSPWFATWLASVSGNQLIACGKIMAAVIVVLLAARLVMRRRLKSLWEMADGVGRRALLGIVATAVLGVAYWFVGAPSLRYGIGFLVTTPALLLALAFPVAAPARLSPHALVRAGWGVVATAVVMAIAVLIWQRPFFAEPQRVPVAALVERRTAGGGTYWLPETGDQCWAAPRYCTPVPVAGLNFGHLGIWPMASAPH